MPSRKVAVVRFPGTNCDRDVFESIEQLGFTPEWWWHGDLAESRAVEAIMLPGGFSYGDYLRAGALSAKSPVMETVRACVKKGVPVLGICNGFQILCESGLLPGVLVKNEGLRFIDEWVELKTRASKFYSDITHIRLPIAHGMGRYTPESDRALAELEDKGQIWLKYVKTPNGSTKDIAGITDVSGKVVGLMPHPERAMAEWMGGSHGRAIFNRVLGA